MARTVVCEGAKAPYTIWFARRDIRTTVKVCTARDEAEYSVMPASVAGVVSFFLNIERVIQRK